MVFPTTTGQFPGCVPGPGDFGLRSHVAGAGLEPGRRGEGSRAGKTQPDAERSGEWSDQIQYFLQILGCFCRDLVWNGFLQLIIRFCWVCWFGMDFYIFLQYTV